MATFAINVSPSRQRAFSAMELTDENIEPGDFFGTTSANHSCVWTFDGSEAVRLGVPDPDYRSRASVDAQSSLRDALSGIPMFQNVEFVIHRMELEPGAYYRRMARPSSHHPLESPGVLPNYRELSNTVMSALNQLRALVRMLDDIVQSVHPTHNNMRCFGNGIRNLIILASTECEAQWRGILAANGINQRQLNTNDYVKLLKPMRLDEYQIKLRHFPWLTGISPFSGWDASSPTQSLGWYDDYNAIKHDRENAFERATLSAAIKTICALWVLVAAQFGYRALREFDDLERYFHLECVPLWRYSEIYTDLYVDQKTVVNPTNYPF